MIQAVIRLLPVAVALLLAACSTSPIYDTDRGFADLLAVDAAPGAPATATALPRLAPGSPRPAYRLGPGDELAITVWGPREVWQDVVPQGGSVVRNVVVQDDGTIVLPLVRRIAVGGLALPDALARIGDAYRGVGGARFQVDASIARHRWQTVLIEGAVAKPGLVALGPEVATLGEALVGAAGGLVEGADATRGQFFRGNRSYALDWPLSQEGTSDLHRIALEPGDRVFFPLRRAGVVYVFGEVGTPGMLTIPPQGITLLQALAQAKGPLVPHADQHALVLVRAVDGAPAIFRFSMEEALAAREVQLQPGDRLYVPTTGLAEWERTIRQAVPMLGGMSVPR